MIPQSQSSVSPEILDDRFGFRGGSGPLDGLTGFYHLSEGDFCFLASTYHPAELYRPPPGSARLQSQSQVSPRRLRANGGSAASSGPASYGKWQLRAARIVAGHSVWFEAQWEGGSLMDLVLKHDCLTWTAFEEAVYTAWKDAAITFGTTKSQAHDTCQVIYVIVGADPATGIKLKLLRMGGDTGLSLATYLCAHLSSKCEQLNGQLEIRQTQLDHARSLAGTAAPPPSQVSSSLVNPGRRKRQHEDDGGFEGDENEGEEEGLSVVLEPMISTAQGNGTVLKKGERDATDQEEEGRLSPLAGRGDKSIFAGKERQAQASYSNLPHGPAADNEGDESDDSETQEDLLSTAMRKYVKG